MTYVKDSLKSQVGSVSYFPKGNAGEGLSKVLKIISRSVAETTLKRSDDEALANKRGEMSLA